MWWWGVFLGKGGILGELCCCFAAALSYPPALCSHHSRPLPPPYTPHPQQVRRAAEPAKNLVREFLSRWKDSPLVEGQDSYRSLTDAIQQLGAFYQANGQRARLTPEVGQAILDTLDAAEAALPAQAEARSLLPFF